VVVAKFGYNLTKNTNAGKNPFNHNKYNKTAEITTQS